MPAVVIVGTGVTGASVAYHLARRGVRDVVAIDREDAICRGNSSKATGGFRAQFGTEINIRLSLLSREKLLSFKEEIGVDSGYRQFGYLFLARTHGELRVLREAQKLQHACGLKEAVMIEDSRAIGGAFCPTDGFIRAGDITRGYFEAAQRLGVRFEFRREVSARELEADVIVNAGGAWASSISDVPVTPLRRRVACTVPTKVFAESTPMTIWAGDGFHFRVRDGRVLLLWPDNPPDDDAWLPTVMAMAHERVPELRNVPIDPAQCWSGLYEMSPDRHAIVGRDPRNPRVVLATGSSGHGVMHAPAIGQLVAELIVDGKTSLDIRALRPERFAEGDLNKGPSLL